LLVGKPARQSAYFYFLPEIALCPIKVAISLCLCLLIVATMPVKQQIKLSKKATTKKATTKKSTTKKGKQVEVFKQDKKVLEAKKVLKTQRMLQAKKQDDEDAREHEEFIEEQERKAAAKKKRKVEFDTKLTALMGVMDKILLLQWNTLHPSQPPPAGLCVWKCKDML